MPEQKAVANCAAQKAYESYKQEYLSNHSLGATWVDFVSQIILALAGLFLLICQKMVLSNKIIKICFIGMIVVSMIMEMIILKKRF